MKLSLRMVSVFAMGTVAACASAPSLSSTVAPKTASSLTLSDVASDSIDVLQCAQHIGARGGFFVDDTTGTVLVRYPNADRAHPLSSAPGRPPVTVDVRTYERVPVQRHRTAQTRIQLTPRVRKGWAKVNARVAGSRSSASRELVRLMNSQCIMRRSAD